MRIGSTFSGVGGLELGLELAGVGETIWQVEVHPFCRYVLKKQWPDVPCYSDVRSVGGWVGERRNAGGEVTHRIEHALEPIDVLCGGSPCQDLSSAGKGAGLSGKRSGLFFEYARLVAELEPPWIVFENVGSGAKRWVDTVRYVLGELGYETLPIPIQAADVGAPHERSRIFLVGRLVTDSYRLLLREQQGRGCGSDREGAGESADHGQEGPARYSDRDSKSAGTKHAEVARVRGLAGPSSPWSAPPEFRGMDDGLSLRLDTLRTLRNAALGNSVVPQCSEVVGHVLLEMAGK